MSRVNNCSTLRPVWQPDEVGGGKKPSKTRYFSSVGVILQAVRYMFLSDSQTVKIWAAAFINLVVTTGWKTFDCCLFLCSGLGSEFPDTISHQHWFPLTPIVCRWQDLGKQIGLDSQGWTDLGLISCCPTHRSNRLLEHFCQTKQKIYSSACLLLWLSCKDGPNVVSHHLGKGNFCFYCSCWTEQEGVPC